MKKRFLFLLLALTLLAPALVQTAHAAPLPGGKADVTTAADAEKSLSGALDTDKLEKSLPEDAKSALDGIHISDSTNLGKALDRLIKNVGGQLGGIVTEGLKSAAIILMTALLCGVVTSAFDGSARYAVLAGVLAISAVSVSSVKTFIGLGGQTLDELDTFSKMLLPTLTAAATAGGAVTSAAAKYAATALFMNILMNVSKNVVMPIIYAFTATSIAEAALGGEGLVGASNLLKWLAKTILTVVMLLFVAYLSLTGVISGTTDAATTKALKTTLQTVLPVVGSIIADASETVLAGASILRNAVGAFGFLAVAALCAAPFLRLGVNYLLYKAAAGLSAAVADSRITKLVNNISAAFGMILGLVGASALMLFISIISVIKAVT